MGRRRMQDGTVRRVGSEKDAGRGGRKGLVGEGCRTEED